MLKMDPDLSGSVLAEAAKAKKLRRWKNQPNSALDITVQEAGCGARLQPAKVRCYATGCKVQEEGCGVGVTPAAEPSKVRAGPCTSCISGGFFADRKLGFRQGAGTNRNEPERNRPALSDR